MRPIDIAFLAVALAVAGGCGKGDSKKGSSVGLIGAAQAQPLPPAPEPAPVPPPKAVQHVELQIASVGNTMAFDHKTLTVPAGAEVHLVFKNESNMTTMAHNWVLVKPGTEADVAAAGLRLGEAAGYLDVSDHDVLAHTGLAKAGETTEVTFTAPEAGKYPYVCTFPGHYMLMKGILDVTP